MTTGWLGWRRETAINKALIANSRSMRDCINHPTTMTREEVEHDSQMQPALVGANVSNVGRYAKYATEHLVAAASRIETARAGMWCSFPRFSHVQELKKA